MGKKKDFENWDLEEGLYEYKGFHNNSKQSLIYIFLMRYDDKDLIN